MTESGRDGCSRLRIQTGLPLAVVLIRATVLRRGRLPGRRLLALMAKETIMGTLIVRVVWATLTVLLIQPTAKVDITLVLVR